MGFLSLRTSRGLSGIRVIQNHMYIHLGVLPEESLLVGGDGDAAGDLVQDVAEICVFLNGCLISLASASSSIK